MMNRIAKITELSNTTHHLNRRKAAGIDQFSGGMLKGGGKVKTPSWKGMKLRSNNRGRTTNFQFTYAQHRYYSTLKGNFTTCTNTKIHHGSIFHAKEMRHRNDKT